MRLLDEQYTKTPFYGVAKMTAWLETVGHCVNIKRVRRLLRLMGLEAIYPKPRLSFNGTEHRRYPYLLRDLPIRRANQVWSADITYIRLTGGFVYLVAVLDWFSRYVLAWELSNTLDTDFCLVALNNALRRGRPDIFNTDQGVQFTSAAFTGRLAGAGIQDRYQHELYEKQGIAQLRDFLAGCQRSAAPEVLHTEELFEVKIGDSMVMIGDVGGGQPKPGQLFMYVENGHALYERALEAGATFVMEPCDRPWADGGHVMRGAGVKDLSRSALPAARCRAMKRSRSLTL